MSTDRSAIATYRGTGLTTQGWAFQQEIAEDYNAKPETVDMTDTSVLEGETGECGGFGNHAGDRVANLTITKVSAPVKTRGIPAGLQTNALGRSSGKGK